MREVSEETKAMAKHAAERLIQLYRRKLLVTVAVPVRHQWPDAPHPVGYLRHEHRHTMRVRVELLVEHGDREIEFHMAQAKILERLAELYPTMALGAHCGLDLGSDSMEHVAQKLLITLDFPPMSKPDEHGCSMRIWAVEAWEDDENGARIERR